MNDLTDTTEERVKDRRLGAKFRREREVGDLKRVLALPEGRRMVRRLLGFCRVFETSMTGTSQTFFNEGMRNVGLMLIREVSEAAPEALLDVFKPGDDES